MRVIQGGGGQALRPQGTRCSLIPRRSLVVWGNQKAHSKPSALKGQKVKKGIKI